MLLRPMHRDSRAVFRLLALLALVLLAGCGFIRFPYVTQGASDFAIAVTPASSTVVAGTPAPGLGFAVAPIGSFNGAVTVSIALQPGFSCAPVQCSAVLPSYTATNVLQLTPSASTPAGIYQFDIVATSGSLSHTVSYSLTVVAATPPDFSFAVTPSTSTVLAGAVAPSYSFAATPLNGFTGTITVSVTPPAGFTCAPVACAATLVANQAPNALAITPSASTATGTYTLSFVATSGTLFHTVTATLVVTAPVVVVVPNQQACAVAAAITPPSSSRTGFAYTGDPNPTSVVYDSRRNRILATNLQYNEIDVISPETMAVTQRLSVPEPMGIDLSADGSTVIIGTRTHYFYRATADTLCMTDRHYLTISGPLNFDLSPMFPVALADGSILFAAYDVASTAQSVYLWTQAAGFTTIPGLGYINYSVRNILPSGDRMHAFFSGDDSGGDYARYDVATGTAISKRVAFGSQPEVLAVNQDGSRAVIVNDCCGIVITDANFNTISTKSGLYVEGIIAEPDFSRFYLKDLFTNDILVTDSSLNPTGSIPAAYAQIQFARSDLRAFDGKHRILALSAGGVAMLDTSTINPVPAAGTSSPTIAGSGLLYGAFNLPTPEAGLTTALSGSNFPSLPSVVMSEGSVSQLATVASNSKTNPVTVTVPAFASGCADVSALFANGEEAFGPQAFCYTPKVYAVDGDSGPSTGGSTLTLYGMGFGQVTPTVSIGGVASRTVTQKFAYGLTNSFGIATLTVIVPPNTPGDEDITIATSFGSTTLPHAFHYAQRSDTALPAGANPIQLLLDAPRGRVLVTDAANNQLLVYGHASGALLNTIPTGTNPQGMALTPDGSKLVLVSGDYKVSVLDANTYATLQQVTVPSTGKAVFGTAPVGFPIGVATMAGNKVYIVTQAGYLQGPANSYSYAALYDYDIATNVLTADPIDTTYFTGGEAFFIGSSADGSTAVIGPTLSHSVGSIPVKSDTSVPSYYDDAVAPDAHTAAIATQFYDNSFHLQNQVTADVLVNGPSYLGETFLYGAQFNGSGSLYFRPAASHVRVYDTQHGNLVRTIAIPDSFTGSNGTATTSPTHLLAVDPAGQQVIAVTTAGISTFKFISDPLSVSEANFTPGHLTLLGSGFAASTVVMVDTLSLPSTFVSTTQLGLTLPTLSPGVHNVTVTNVNGDVYTLTLAFTTP